MENICSQEGLRPTNFISLDLVPESSSWKLLLRTLKEMMPQDRTPKNKSFTDRPFPLEHRETNPKVGIMSFPWHFLLVIKSIILFYDDSPCRLGAYIFLYLE